MADQINLIGLTASIASLVLAVVAIALSIIFFMLGLKQASQAESASSSIAGSVQRLETLFDRLYSDTFSMVKKTMDDMSSHIWRKEDVQPTDEARVTSEVLEAIARLGREVGITQDQVNDLQTRMGPVVRDSVDDAADRRPPLRFRILTALRRREQSDRPAPTLRELTQLLSRRVEVDEGEVASTLFTLREQNRVTWDGDGGLLSATSQIHLVPTEQPGPDDSQTVRKGP